MSKQNLGESVRQRLKNLSVSRKRPFDEILRYYAIERFLYRLSVSSYTENFFLKGGLMLRVWNSFDHRATMDIDFLARISNQVENLHRIITEVASIACEEDAVYFDTDNLILRAAQTTGEYDGMRASFRAKLFTTKIPVLIDIGFNDLIVPQPQVIKYPTLLEMPSPTLLGYTIETVVAEKLESIVTLAYVNTRMKDFYDLWTILKYHVVKADTLKKALTKVFANRETPFRRPVAFTPDFYDTKEAQQRWNNFLTSLGAEPIPFKEVIQEITSLTDPFFKT